MATHKAQKRYITELVVEGSGEFPIDMLRYDRCVPATEHDAHIITRAMRDPSKIVERVKLLRYGANPVQIEGERRMEWGRWESFGWRVYSEERVQF